MPAGDRLAQLVRDNVRAYLAVNRRRQWWVAEQAGITEKHLSQIMNSRTGVTTKLAETLLSVVGQQLILRAEPIQQQPGGGDYFA